MSTATQTFTEQMATRDASKAGAESAYRAAVYAEVETGLSVSKDVRDAVMKMRHQVERDLQVYRDRRHAHELLDVRVPELRRAVADAEKAAAGVLPYAARKIDGLTVGELIQLVNLAQSSQTPPEFTALAIAREAPARVINQAQKILRDTADPAIHALIGDLSQTASRLSDAIAAAEETLNLGPKIDAQRQHCEDLAEGRGLNIGSYESREQQYKAARAKLDELVKRYSTAPAVRQKMGSDQAALDTINQQIARLKDKLMNPRCQQWAD